MMQQITVDEFFSTKHRYYIATTEEVYKIILEESQKRGIYNYLEKHPHDVSKYVSTNGYLYLSGRDEVHYGIGSTHLNAELIMPPKLKWTY